MKKKIKIRKLEKKLEVLNNIICWQEEQIETLTILLSKAEDKISFLDKSLFLQTSYTEQVVSGRA
jgi:hypothetical protein